MYIPSAQSIVTAGMAVLGSFGPQSVVTSGSCLDYEVEKCIDEDGNQRCSKPFAVTKSTCYNIEWSTEGALAHTTAEVRDAGSGELIFYRDTDGEWTTKKAELVYIDFKPKVPGQGNKTVNYKVTTCE